MRPSKMTRNVTPNSIRKPRTGPVAKVPKPPLTSQPTFLAAIGERKRKQAESDDGEFSMGPAVPGKSNRSRMQASVRDAFPRFSNGSVLIQLSSDP